MEYKAEIRLTLAAPASAPHVATHAASFVSSVSKCPCFRTIVLILCMDC